MHRLLLSDRPSSVSMMQRFPWWAFALINLFIALVILVFLLPSSAWAQDATATTRFDFGPWVLAALQFLEPTILGVVSLFGLFVLQRVGAWLGLRIDDSRRAALDQALFHAVAFAMEKVGDRAKAGIPIDLKHDAIATAAAYAERSVPGALRHFGIGEERLAEMVESRLEGILFDPSQVPAEGDIKALRMRPASFSASPV